MVDEKIEIDFDGTKSSRCTIVHSAGGIFEGDHGHGRGEGGGEDVAVDTVVIVGEEAHKYDRVSRIRRGRRGRHAARRGQGGTTAAGSKGSSRGRSTTRRRGGDLRNKARSPQDEKNDAQRKTRHGYSKKIAPEETSPTRRRGRDFQNKARSPQDEKKDAQRRKRHGSSTKLALEVSSAAAVVEPPLASTAINENNKKKKSGGGKGSFRMLKKWGNGSSRKVQFQKGS